MSSEVKRGVVRLLVGSSILLVCATVVVLGIGQAADIDATKLKTHALVTWYDVGAPAGKFLLIRKDANLCAIKFTEYYRANDAKSSTFFRSGDETRDAKYECFCQSEKGDGFGNATLGEVSTRSSWGIGRSRSSVDKEALGVGSSGYLGCIRQELVSISMEPSWAITV